MLIKAMKLYFLGLSLCLGMLCTFVAQSTMAAQAPLKLSELLQQPVFTDGGQELGKVVDVALDEQAQQINFVVISVASFLVEENLIAVHPDALIYRRSSDAASADASASSSSVFLGVFQNGAFQNRNYSASIELGNGPALCAIKLACSGGCITRAKCRNSGRKKHGFSPAFKPGAKAQYAGFSNTRFRR